MQKFIVTQQNFIFLFLYINFELHLQLFELHIATYSLIAQCSSTKAAFQVYNDFDYNALKLSPVNFRHLLINIGNAYVTSKNSFRPCKAGLYWFHFDTFADNLGRTNYTMRDVTTGEDYSSILTDSITNAWSLNDLRNLTSQSQLQMFSHYPHNKQQNVAFGMTWGGISIDSISTDPPTAFSVVRRNGVIASDNISSNTSNKIHSSKTALQFDFSHVNTGQCWNETTDSFTAPITGIYILSFSIVTTIKEAQVHFVINRNVSGPYHEPSRESCVISMTESTLKTFCCSKVLKLGLGDTVYIELSEEHFWNHSKQIYEQASFKGFLYAPTKQISIAWYVKNTNNFKSDLLNDLIFDNAVVNIGEVFKSKDKK